MPSQAQNIAYATQKAIKKKYGSYKKAKQKTGIKSSSLLEEWASKNLIAQKRTKSFKEALKKYGESKEKKALSKQKEFLSLQKSSRRELREAQILGLTVPEYKSHLLRTEVFSNVARGERRKELRNREEARTMSAENFIKDTEGLSNPQILSSLKGDSVPSVVEGKKVTPSVMSIDPYYSFPKTKEPNFLERGAAKGNPISKLFLEIGTGTKSLFNAPIGSNIPRIVLGKEQTGTKIYTEKRVVAGLSTVPKKVEKAVVLGGGALFSGVTLAAKTGKEQKILPLITDIGFLGVSTGFKGGRLADSLTKGMIDKPYSYSGANFEWKQLADSRAGKVVSAGIKAPAYGFLGSLPGKGTKGVGRVLSKAQIRNINLGRAYNPNVRTKSYSQGNKLIKELTIKSKNKGVKSKFTVKSSYSLTESGGSVLRDAGIVGESFSLGRGFSSLQGRLIPVFKTTKNINVFGGKHKKFKGVLAQLGEKKNVFYGGKPSRIIPSFNKRSTLRMFDSEKKPFKFIGIRKSSPIDTGSGVLLQTQKPLGHNLLKQDYSIKQIKKLTLNQQKQGFYSDPAKSSYSAKNILGDVKTDLGTVGLYDSFFSTNKVSDGFRLGMKEKILGGEERISFIKSDLRGLLGVELPKGGLSREFAVTGVKSSLDYRSGFKTGASLDLSTKSALDYDADTVSSSSLINKNKLNLSSESKVFPIINTVSFSRSKIASDTSQKKKTLPKQKLFLAPKIFLPRNKPPSKTGLRIIPPPSLIPPPIGGEDDFFRKPPQKTTIKKPRKVRKPKLSFGVEKKSSSSFFGGYSVSVRRKGRFELLGSGLTRQQAIFKGSRAVGTSAAATFKISGVGGKDSTGLGFVNKDDFYSKGGGIFVEKRGRRIKSGGELKEITFKGLAAKKKKKGGFFF